MVRTLATFVLALTLSALHAQEREIHIQDDQAMLDKASAKTELVERTVGRLSEEQREQVYDVYLHVERHMVAVEKRFEGQPEADKEADMPHIYESMDKYVAERLAVILDEGQLAKWNAADPAKE